MIAGQVTRLHLNGHIPAVLFLIRGKIKFQFHLKLCPLTQLAFYLDRAAHQIDQSLGDAQSQAGPFHLGDLFAPVKWFEQSVEEFITDADSGILNCEAVAYASVPLYIDLLNTEDDHTALQCELEGIAQKIDQDLLDSQRIAGKFDMLEHTRLNFEAQAYVFRLRGHNRGYISDQLLNMDRLKVQMYFRLFDLAHIQNVIDQAE